MEMLKELLAKLKSQRSGKEPQYLYGYDKGCHEVREEVIQELERIIDQMESDELSAHIQSTYYD